MADDKQKLINKFVTRVMKAKGKKQDKELTKEQVRLFLKKQGKRWAANWEMLFNKTWKMRPKKINHEEELEIKKDDAKLHIPKASPKEIQISPGGPKIRRVKPLVPEEPAKEPRVIKVKTSFVAEPNPTPLSETKFPAKTVSDKIHSPKVKTPLVRVLPIQETKRDYERGPKLYGPDTPLNPLPEKERECQTCHETFIQNNDHPSRFFCDKCLDKTGNIQEWNGVVAKDDIKM